MIKSFLHRGVKRFFETGSKAGIQPSHAAKLAKQLMQLNIAQHPLDMDYPGWHLHSLQGDDLHGHWSVKVNANWRLTFRFDGKDAILVDYQDYH